MIVKKFDYYQYLEEKSEDHSEKFDNIQQLFNVLRK